MIAPCGERKPAANAARLMFGDQTDQSLGVSPRFPSETDAIASEACPPSPALRADSPRGGE